MNITKDDSNLILKFDYNPALIEIIKKFNSRKFIAKTKEWTIPIIHVIEVLETLIPLGFTTTQEVRNIYDEEIKKRKKIKKILAADFNKKENELFEKIKLPLFDFQKIGTGFLCVSKSSLLADEPGLGKTIQSLAVITINNSKRTLIICPNTLKLNWADEIQKWLPKKKIIIIQGTKEKRNELWKKTTDFHIMNYEILLKDIEEIKKIQWDFIISDESTRISNPKAKQSKLIKTIKAEHRLALTGTPLNNSIQDVWNILDFCQPGLLGNYWNFTEKFCLKNHWGAITGYKNLSELKKYISDYMIRRKKIEVLSELPEKVFETIYIDLSDKERKIYNAIKDEIVKELKEYEINDNVNTTNLSNILVKMVRLNQVSDSTELVSELKLSSKTEALKELLNDIMNENTKAIVFTEFAKMAKILHKELTNYNPFLFIGETSKEERYEIVKKFNENEKNKVLIMTRAGAEGLNLQRANYIIHFDLPWSISRIEQREGRAHRIGQKSALTIYKLITNKTIDEYILKVLHKKQRLSEEILGDKERIRKVKLSKKDIDMILR